jgi:hypothetical protein
MKYDRKEFTRAMEEMMANLARQRERRPPDWVEAHIALIDALRDYLWADEVIGKELMHEGSITKAQYDNGMAENAPLAAILKKLEAHEIDPTLDGTIKP